MYVKSPVFMPMFKAKVVTEPELPSETEFMQMLREKGNIDWTLTNEAGDTLFQTIVDENYTKLVSYMIARQIDLSAVINKPNSQGKTPLASSKSAEMSVLIKRAGGLMSVPKSKCADLPKEDAKDIAARTYMTQPVMDKIGVKSDTPAETQSTGFFGAFVEIDDDQAEETTPVTVSDTQTLTDVEPEPIKESAEGAKPVPKKLNVEGLKDFKILKITSNDVLSLKDLIGRKEIKSELTTNVIAPLKDSNVAKMLKENNIDIPNGILFVADGGGEMTIIKALSNEAEIPAVIMENPQELEQILIAVEARYDEGKGPKTIILAQGFDKYFSNCTTSDNTNANKFRNNIRDISKKGGLFIATARDKKQISDDFMQSGIIDKIFDVPRPNENDKTEFLKRYFETREIFKDVNNEEDIQKMVKLLTNNLTYADTLRILKETARTASANGKKVDIEIFEKQIQDFSKELDLVPITEENRTASYDKHIKRIPITPGEIMSLDELGGAFKIKDWLRKLYVDPLRHPEKMRRKNKIPDGAIFYGSPGNGKSTFARVLARELKLPYYQINLSDLGQDSLVGQASRDFKAMVQDLKDKYQVEKEMSVLFLDEFESLGAARDKNQGQYAKELTDTLLQVLDNPAEYGIIVIGATNNLEDIDPALKRRGRLGKHKEFENPNQEEREDIIVKLLSKYVDMKEFIEDKKWVTKLAKELDGFATSSIKFILDDAIDDYDLHDIDFDEAIKNATNKEIENLLGELCGKTQLKQHVYSEIAPRSFAELAGMDDVIEQLKDRIMKYWDPEIRQKLIEYKIEPPGGFMLEGPSGGGKTTVIETMALEMGVPLFYMELDEEQNMFVGGIDKSIKEIFEQLALIAKVRKGPVMLLFDEATRFFPRTNASQLGNHMLGQTEKLKSIMNYAAEKGIILAGTTNHIDLVNQEVIENPRRMGTVIHVGLPNLEARKAIANKLLCGHPLIDGIVTQDDTENIGFASDGLTVGELSRAIKNMLTNALCTGKKLRPEGLVNDFKTEVAHLHMK